MQELRDNAGKFICQVGTIGNKIWVRDYYGKAVGYGRWETQWGMLLTYANRIDLFWDNGVMIGDLKPELGPDGRPSYVVFSGPHGTARIPAQQFSDQPIMKYLFEERLGNGANTAPNTASTGGTSGGSTGGGGDTGSSIGVIFWLIVAAAALFLVFLVRSFILSHDRLVSAALETFVPILLGAAVLLCCAVGKRRSAATRIAGLLEGFATMALSSLFLRLSLPGNTDFVDTLYDAGSALTASNGVLQGLYILLSPLLIYFLLFLPLLVLALVFLLVARHQRGGDARSLLAELNQTLHPVISVVCFVLFFLAFISYNFEFTFTSIAMMLFTTLYIAPAYALILWLSHKLLDRA